MEVNGGLKLNVLHVPRSQETFQMLCFYNFCLLNLDQGTLQYDILSSNPHVLVFIKNQMSNLKWHLLWLRSILLHTSLHTHTPMSCIIKWTSLAAICRSDQTWLTECESWGWVLVRSQDEDCHSFSGASVISMFELADVMSMNKAQTNSVMGPWRVAYDALMRHKYGCADWIVQGWAL